MYVSDVTGLDTTTVFAGSKTVMLFTGGNAGAFKGAGLAGRDAADSATGFHSNGPVSFGASGLCASCSCGACSTIRCTVALGSEFSLACCCAGAADSNNAGGGGPSAGSASPGSTEKK